MKKIKMLVVGYGRHGKDAFTEFFSEVTGLKFTSSSAFACVKAVYPKLKDLYGYNSIEECYNDRVNHRVEWKELISEYNSPDKSKLARALLEENDIYVGLRCIDELNACIDNNLFDIMVWINNPRVPEEPLSSCTIRHDSKMWDYVIQNDGDLNDLKYEAIKLANQLGL